MKHQINTTKKMILTGMFTAVLSVMSQIQIPMPSGVPLSLQTFAVALNGYILGWKRGMGTIGIYLLLGLIGLPVFTGFTGGLGKIAGPTGGFLIGFLFLAASCGYGRVRKKSIAAVVIPGTGLLICHLLGIIHFSSLMERSFLEAALLMSVPYFWKDVLSVAAAYMTARMLRKRINLTEIR